MQTVHWIIINITAYAIGWWVGVLNERYEFVLKAWSYLRRLYYRWKNRNKVYPPYDPGPPITITYVGGPWDSKQFITSANIRIIRGFTRPDWSETIGLRPNIDYDLIEIEYRKSPDDPNKFIYVEPNTTP